LTTESSTKATRTEPPREPPTHRGSRSKAARIDVRKQRRKPDKTGQAPDSKIEWRARRIKGLQENSSTQSGNENFKRTGQATPIRPFLTFGSMEIAWQARIRHAHGSDLQSVDANPIVDMAAPATTFDNNVQASP
jgi:hypothetical protein